MTKIDRFEDIVAWQKARLLNKELFKDFSGTRNFTLRDQILRASLSITNNIAEGFERGSAKELHQFLIIARGSTAEVRSILYTALDSNILNRKRHDELKNLTIEIGRMLTAFIKSIKTIDHRANSTTK